MKIAERSTRIGVSVKLTPQEHEALKALVWREGHTSFQSFFRSLAVQRIRAAQAQAGPEDPSNAA
jgi:hypothetical protein